MDTPQPNIAADGHHPRQLGAESWLEYVKRVATPPTDDEHNVIAGLSCPPTREEIQAFVDCEQARIRRERGLPPPS